MCRVIPYSPPSGATGSRGTAANDGTGGDRHAGHIRRLAVRNRLARFGAAIPAPARGALWAILGAAGIAVMTALIRHTSHELHPFVVGFFRSLFGLLIMVPWLMKVGLRGLRTKKLHLYLLRGTTGMIGLMTWFSAVAYIPVAEATALFFTSSLFATVLAIFVLGEKVGPRRWGAALVGFAGVLIILRPGIVEPSYGAMLALASALTVGFSMTFVKLLSRTEPVFAIITYMTIILTPLSLIPALFFWQWPTLATLGWLALLAGSATIGHIGITRAFGLADTTAILPFFYFQLPFVALIGFVAFAELPDIYTWLGAGVIASSSIYIAHREARLARAPGADPPVPKPL